MSELKTDKAHNPQFAGAAEAHPVNLNSYIRLCGVIFFAVLCTTALMIYASFLPHFGWTAKVAMTVFFFIGLVGLTMWAMNDFPTGTAIH
jgi:hypothetical protein